MNKNVLLLIVLVFLTQGLFSQVAGAELGIVQSKNGPINVDYMKAIDNKGDYIRLSSTAAKIYTNIYVTGDLADIRKFIDKFAEWHQIAIDNKWGALNKTIGTFKYTRTEFATVNNLYEFLLIDTKSGAKIVSFDLAQAKALKETITDAKIDDAINSEKRKKEKENTLFK